MLKILAVSDLHIGEPDSVLHFRYPSLICEFADFVHKQARKGLLPGETEPGIETLVLCGDIPDYTLASFDSCITNNHILFDALLLGKFHCPTDGKDYLCNKTKINNVVYLPGNHDHVLWSDFLKVIVAPAMPEADKLPERKCEPYAVGRLILKDEASNLDPNKAYWSIYGDNGFEVPPAECHQVPQSHFLYKDPNNPAYSFMCQEHWFPISALDFFIGEKAAATIQRFTVQNPHYHFQFQGEDYLFLHGHHFRKDVAGSSLAYHKKTAMESITIFNHSRPKALNYPLMTKAFDAGLIEDHRKDDLEKEVERFTASLSDEEIESICRDLNLQPSITRRDSLHTALEASSVGTAYFKSTPNLPDFSKDGAWDSVNKRREIGYRLKSVITCFAKLRDVACMAKPTLLELERASFLFIDNLWYAARNDDKPINDSVWNGVGIFGKLWGNFKHALGIKAKIEKSLPSVFLELYLAKCTELKQKNLIFVFGDTHDPEYKALLGSIPNRDVVRVYNLGVWHVRQKNTQPEGKVFTVDHGGVCRFEDIKFDTNQLNKIEPFKESKQ